MGFAGLFTWQWGPNGQIGPQAWSVFHIAWLIICVALCVGAVFLAKKRKDPKLDDRIILITVSILLVTEVIKQYMYDVEYYHYLRVDVLPFSLCSIPLYVGFIGSLIKNEKVKNACYGFLSFFGIVGGMGTMLYPVTLYTSFIFISFQTMIWHTLLIAMAVYLIPARGFGKNFKKEMLPAFGILVATSLMAVGLNEVMHHAYLEPRQTPECSLERAPGAYEYLKYGYQDDSFHYLSDDDGTLVITDNYSKAVDTVITYYDDDGSAFYLQYDNANGETKYIDIIDDNGTIKVASLDAPINTWNFSWITGERAVFAVELTDGTYYMDFSNKSVNAIKKDDVTDNTVLGDFITGKLEREGDAANFFFISNHCDTPIPVLNLIQYKVPYPVFVAIYLIGFGTISSGIWGIAYGINKLTRKKN